MYKEIICLEIEQTFSSQDDGRFLPKIRICKTKTFRKDKRRHSRFYLSIYYSRS